MPLELFKTSGSEGCVITLRDEGDIRLRLESPFDLILCFMNNDYTPLLASRDERQRLVSYFSVAFAGPEPAALRDFIEHVLVCETARGFDPVARLAAYAYCGGPFGFSGADTRCAETRELETSVVGKEAASNMARRWAAASERSNDREALFAALLEDAAEQSYPFELAVSMEYPTLAHLLRALAGEMVLSRRFLRRCPICGRYAVAEALPFPCPCGAQTAAPQAPPPFAKNPETQAVEHYKQIYQRLADQAGREDTALAGFEGEAREWRRMIRYGKATWEEFGAWLREKG